MNKNIFSSIVAQLILLVFVIVWILPTFGLFISSFRDKDLLAISGWWTSLITTQVNEIYRTENKDAQIQDNNIYIIKGNIFDSQSGKKITNIFRKYLNKENSEQEKNLKNDYERIFENNDISKYTIDNKLEDNKDKDNSNNRSCVIC